MSRGLRRLIAAVACSGRTMPRKRLAMFTTAWAIAWTELEQSCDFSSDSLFIVYIALTIDQDYIPRPSTCQIDMVLSSPSVIPVRIKATSKAHCQPAVRDCNGRSGEIAGQIVQIRNVNKPLEAKLNDVPACSCLHHPFVRLSLSSPSTSRRYLGLSTRRR
jgi:hypothetical protein